MDISSNTESAAKPKAALTFQNVYRANFRLVWRALARLGVPEADRKDLTQNVFIIVHRQLAGFEGRSTMTTWLCAICRFVARDYRRSARIRREVVLDSRDIARRMVDAGGGISQSLGSQDPSHLVESILNRIPEKLRVVFVMYEVDELSGEEIARQLNMPVGTVRSRLRLARELLQRNVRASRDHDDEAPIGPELLYRAQVAP
jgi:RNA polymerase sigma-70 factor (ECF subfamily)